MPKQFCSLYLINVITMILEYNVFLQSKNQHNGYLDKTDHCNAVEEGLKLFDGNRGTVRLSKGHVSTHLRDRYNSTSVVLMRHQSEAGSCHASHHRKVKTRDNHGTKCKSSFRKGAIEMGDSEDFDICNNEFRTAVLPHVEGEKGCIPCTVIVSIL